MKYKATPFNIVTGLIALWVIIWLIYVKLKPMGPPSDMGYALFLFFIPFAAVIFCIDLTIQFGVQFINASRKYLWVRIIELLALIIGLLWIVLNHRQ
jgi:hypothetical protein